MRESEKRLQAALTRLANVVEATAKNAGDPELQEKYNDLRTDYAGQLAENELLMAEAKALEDLKDKMRDRLDKAIETVEAIVSTAR